MADVRRRGEEAGPPPSLGHRRPTAWVPAGVTGIAHNRFAMAKSARAVPSMLDLVGLTGSGPFRQRARPEVAAARRRGTGGAKLGARCGLADARSHPLMSAPVMRSRRFCLLLRCVLLAATLDRAEKYTDEEPEDE